MERMAWTDERLEERFNGVDRRFDEIRRQFEQIDRRFDRIEGEIVELRRGIAGLQTTLNRIGGSMFVGLVGVIVAILAKGV